MESAEQKHVNLFNEISNRVRDERNRQIEKWGNEFYGRSDSFWLTILAEEFGEIANAILERKPDRDIVEEIVQTAAVCFSWLESRTPTSLQYAVNLERGNGRSG